MTALVVALMGTVLVPTAAHADRSNTLGGATTASPTHTVVRETLQSGSDVDFFRFTTTRSGYSRVLLTSVPRDYAIQLFTKSGSRIATSQRAGRAFEEIYRYLKAGTYFVKVYSPARQYSGTAYSLAFRPLADGVHLLSSRWRKATGYTEVFGEVLNNTGSPKYGIKATTRFYNSSGNVVYTIDSIGHTAGNTLGARARSVFRVSSDNVPSTAVRHRVTLSWQAGAVNPQPPVGGLTLRATATAYPTYVSFKGTVTNRSGGTARYIEVATARYTSGGAVYSTDVVRLNPDQLANGETGTFQAQAATSSAVTYARWFVFGYR